MFALYEFSVPEFDFEFSAALHTSDTAGSQNTFAGVAWDLLTTTGTLTLDPGVVQLNVFSMVNDSTRGLNNTSQTAPLTAFDKETGTDALHWLFARADSGLIYSGDINDHFVVDASQVTGLYGPPSTLAGHYWVSATSTGLYLNYSAVPEPGSLVCCSIAGLALAAHRRRKLRRRCRQV